MFTFPSQSSGKGRGLTSSCYFTQVLSETECSANCTNQSTKLLKTIYFDVNTWAVWFFFQPGVKQDAAPRLCLIILKAR